MTMLQSVTARISPLLHIVVLTLAAMSASTGGYYLWIDLRFAGPIVSAMLPAFWNLSVFAVILALIAHRPALARVLLWPTYLVIACLLANLAFYLRLRSEDRIDAGRFGPITQYMIALLVLWTWQCRQPRTFLFPLQRWQQGVAVACVLAMGWFFYLPLYRDQPRFLFEGGRCVAVVLGHRVLPGGSASETLRYRTLAAIELYRAGKVNHLFLSGMLDKQGDGSYLSEVAAMANVCREFGIPEKDITLDPTGVNTRATAAYMRHRFKQFAQQPEIIACTSDYHLLRTQLAFRQAGFRIAVVPSRPPGWICADPFDILRETAGVIAYRFFPSYRPAKVDQMNVKSPRIVVTKSKNTLELFDGSAPVKTYACITGSNPGDKEIEGDRKTPVGHFKIVYKNPESKFHLSMGLDYPNSEDAARGLAEKKLTQAQYDELMGLLKGGDMTQSEVQEKVWKTPLGGEIFIHGHAEGRTGTAGCVAVSNPDIEELYAVCEEGTPVEIRE